MNLQKQLVQMKFSTNKIDEEIMSLLQDQIYLKKGAQGANRDRSKLRIKINEKVTSVKIAKKYKLIVLILLLLNIIILTYHLLLQLHYISKI